MSMLTKLPNFFKSSKKEIKEPTETRKSKAREDTTKELKIDMSDKILLDFVMMDPLINACVQTYVENIVPSYSFEPIEDGADADKQVEEAEAIFKKDNQIEKLKNIAFNLTVWANAYQEKGLGITLGEKTLKTWVLNTTEIRPKVKGGEVIAFEQIRDEKVIATLDLKEIIHYKNNVIGDDVVGTPLIRCVLFNATIRKFIEKYNIATFKNQKPRGMFSGGEEISDEQWNTAVDGIIASKEHSHKDIFVKGGDIKFTSFMEDNKGAFLETLKEARREIMIGMLVPPILLSSPEDSNISNSDAQMQSFDRRIESRQKAIEDKVNTEILEILGFDKIRFKLNKSHKRDEVREVDIVQKLKGVATLNEVRDKLGYSKLDPAEYEEAEELFTGGQSASPFGLNPSENMAKSLSNDNLKKKRKILKIKPVTAKSEKDSIRLFKEWTDNIKKAMKPKLPQMFKAIINIDDFVNTYTELMSSDLLANSFCDKANEQYNKGAEQVEKYFGRNILPNNETIRALRKYNFDLVTGLQSRTRMDLRNILERASLEGKGSIEVANEVSKALDKSFANSEALVRTELSRANNTGAFNTMQETAEELGLEVKKYLLMVDDNRTSEVSRKAHAKYGSEELAIPMSENFEVIVNGKIYSSNTLPLHINDRDSLAFVLG